MSAPLTPKASKPGSWPGDCRALALLTAFVSLGSLVFYSHRGAVLLYGDAVAHINIARRVFDSRTPGLFQLGTVWLPLPHLLDIPFVVNDWLWRTGLGASFPSMLAYVAGTLGVFRLVRGLTSRTAAWIAAVIFALNPNLIYMQTTAMTEPLYLALFVWTVVFFSEFAREARDAPDCAGRSLRKCAITLCAAMLVRYDAWFLAAGISFASLCVVWRLRMASPLRGSTAPRALSQDLRLGLTHAAPPAPQEGEPLSAREVTTAAIRLVALVVVTAGLWLAYNYAHWGNPLEFANGPYSAHAIQQRARAPAMPTYPGENSPRVAALYFFKVSRLNLGQGLAEQWLFTIAIAALLAAVFFSRKFLPWVLLWTPALFYALCIAWASVPIYFPQWWPNSYYNVRYGLQLLPAVAVFVALAYEFLSQLARAWKGDRAANGNFRDGSPGLTPPFTAPAHRTSQGGLHAGWMSDGIAIAFVFVLTASYGSIWRRPICLREAEANGAARLQFDAQLANQIKTLPASSILLMDCSAHPGAVQAAGIPFRRVLRESNPPYWEAALSDPSRMADYSVAIAGDAVDRAVRRSPQHFKPVATIGAAPGPRAIIYQSARH